MKVPPNVVMDATLAMRSLSFAAFHTTRASEMLPTLRWGSRAEGVSDALMDSGLVYGRGTSAMAGVVEWARANDPDAARAEALSDLYASSRIWQELLLGDSGRASMVEQTRTQDPAGDPNAVLIAPSKLPSLTAMTQRLAKARDEALAGVKLLSDFLSANGS